MDSIIGNFKQGYALLMKTVPYLIMRLTIYGVYGLGAIVFFIIFFLLAKLFGDAGGIVVLLALGIFGGFYYWSRRYLLYMVKVGHVAVFTEIYAKGSLPEGVDQFQYGKDLVKNRVKDMSILFAVDALVDGILRAFSRTVANIADLLPIPGLEGLTRAGTAIINRSLTYIDEAIFSYSILKEENLWVSSKNGVILYAQSWKELLKTAVAIWLADKVFIVTAAIILLIPFGMLAAAIPSLNWAFLLSAIALAVLADAAIFEPLALATMIITFQETVKEQTPDAEWEAKLESISTKFRELKDKAAEAISSKGPVPAPANPGTDPAS